MHYAGSVPFDGNTVRALDLATAVLTPLGFQIVAWDKASLDLVGPGMNSTKQSALLGASRMRIVREAHRLSIEAELGGVQRMSRFIQLFPVGLSFFLCVFLSLIFGLIYDHRGWVVPVVVATGGNALVWLLLAPPLKRLLHHRTRRSIDTLLNNMAAAGNEG